MRGFKSVMLACPGNATTAGPEAIHQLVADLNRLGQSAYVVYFPFDRAFQTAEPYRKYHAPVTEYRDEPGDLIIFPEIVTTYALKVKHAEAAIWWMSVNNFTCVRYGRPWRDKLRYFKYFLKGLRPWGGIKALKHLRHFAQSQYAVEFLTSQGVHADLLSDPIPVYTTPAYLAGLAEKRARAQRRNRILYNPSKGAKVTQRLRETFPQWEYLPLIGYGREALAELFLSSKIYMDFGHHPGKDRLPREAAIHGCCVITGTNGSAANAMDVPIPARYKLDDKRPDFIKLFELVVGQIYGNFDECSKDFENYRRTIAQEQVAFDQQIVRAFGIQ